MWRVLLVLVAGCGSRDGKASGSDISNTKVPGSSDEAASGNENEGTHHKHKFYCGATLNPQGDYPGIILYGLMTGVDGGKPNQVYVLLSCRFWKRDDPNRGGLRPDQWACDLNSYRDNWPPH